jgi:hypothetical protein
MDAVKALGTEPEPVISELLVGLGAGLGAGAEEGEAKTPSVATREAVSQGGNFLYHRPIFGRIGQSRVLWSGLDVEVSKQKRHCPFCCTTPLCQRFMW